MTDLLDQRPGSTLSGSEVWSAWPPFMPGSASGWLSESEIRVVACGPRGSFSLGAMRRIHGRHHRRAADLLEPLLSLRDGWDGHGAVAPDPQALVMASHFLTALNQAPLPDVMASVGGGVILEWEGADTDLVIEILGSQHATVYVRRGEIEEEGPLSMHQQAAAEALAALSVAAH